MKAVEQKRDLENTEISAMRKTATGTYPLHWHDYFELELIVSGKGSQLLNGQAIPLAAGTVYLLGPTDFHTVTITEPMDIYTIQFPFSVMPADMLELCVKASGRVYPLSARALRQFSDLANLLSDGTRHGEPPAYMQMLLQCLLFQFCKQIAGSAFASQPKKSDIQAAKLYMHLHFRENPSLAAIADFVHLTPNYLSACFRTQTGKTLSEYLVALKIDYAKKLLCTTELSVTDVCFTSGYTSVSNFLRAFRKAVGTSPRQYKQAHSKNAL